jgi:hypothetical protein
LISSAWTALLREKASGSAAASKVRLKSIGGVSGFVVVFIQGHSGAATTVAAFIA